MYTDHLGADACAKRVRRARVGGPVQVRNLLTKKCRTVLPGDRLTALFFCYPPLKVQGEDTACLTLTISSTAWETCFPASPRNSEHQMRPLRHMANKLQDRFQDFSVFSHHTHTLHFMANSGPTDLLDLAVSKKAALKRALVLAVDPSMKFKLQEEIKELEQEIAQLQDTSSRRIGKAKVESRSGNSWSFLIGLIFLIVACLIGGGVYAYADYQEGALADALVIAERQLENDEFQKARATLSGVDPLHTEPAVVSMIDSIRFYEKINEEVDDWRRRGDQRSQQNKHEAAIEAYQKAFEMAKREPDKLRIKSLIEAEEKVMKGAVPSVEPVPAPQPNKHEPQAPVVPTKPKLSVGGVTEFVRIKGGSFILGDLSSKSADAPPIEVEVKSFQIGTHEVTNKEYSRFLNERSDLTVSDVEKYFPRGLVGTTDTRILLSGGEYVSADGFENHPVVGVSWHGAMAFAQFYGWRLPTEVEWEYAAACNSSGVYAGGADLNKNGWYRSNTQGKVQSVQGKKPNACGVFDMSGNVSEWCSNDYERDVYQSLAAGRSLNFNDGSRKSRRGGGADDGAQSCRIFYRRSMYPQLSNSYLGFRVAK